MKRNIQLKQFSLSLFIFSLLMTLFTGCDGEKDLKIIDGNLPIKTSTLFMVGDATPNGWSIDDPTPFTQKADDPMLFTWEGTLNAGEMKLCLVAGSYDNPFIRPVNDQEIISKSNVSGQTFAMWAGALITSGELQMLVNIVLRLICAIGPCLPNTSVRKKSQLLSLYL